MVALTSICFLLGAGFGLRFRVFILIPVIGLSWVVVAANGLFIEETFWRLALIMIVVAAAIQAGYFSGTVAQSIVGSIGSKAQPQPASDTASRTA